MSSVKLHCTSQISQITLHSKTTAVQEKQKLLKNVFVLKLATLASSDIFLSKI